MDLNAFLIDSNNIKCLVNVYRPLKSFYG